MRFFICLSLAIWITILSALAILMITSDPLCTNPADCPELIDKGKGN